MTSKELIEELLKVDPDGTTEVCLNNCPIWLLEPKPAYYDGVLQILIRDENKKGYNIKGMKFSTKGHKIHIKTANISDILFMNPDAILDFNDICTEESKKELEKSYNKRREELRHLRCKIDSERAEGPGKEKDQCT